MALCRSANVDCQLIRTRLQTLGSTPNRLTSISKYLLRISFTNVFSHPGLSIFGGALDTGAKKCRSI